jgi:Tol biopolymer transport system component
MTQDLAIRDLSTGTSRLLTSKAPGEPYQEPGPGAVSPDGTQVAYSWWGENGEDLWDLRIVGIDGSDERVVYSNKEAQLAWAAPDWSQDGAQLLVLLQKRDLIYQIALISVATGSARILRSLDWRRPGKMALSPDGRFVLYDFPPTPESRHRDIYVLSTDATSNTPLVADAANDIVLGWVDDQHVLFASDRSGTPGAYLQRVKDGRAEGVPELVKPDLWRIEPGGATRNGAYYYTVNTASTDIFTTTLDPATGRVITSPTLIARDGTHPAWSRDGRYLAYISTPTPFSPAVVRVRSVDTGETRELYPRLDLTEYVLYTGNMHWFPDGSALLVRARDLTNRMGFFRIDSQTGAVSLVWSTGDSADMVSGAPVLSPDGKTLFFTRRDVVNSRMQIVGVDLEKRTERVVVSTEGAIITNALAVSPDGQHLAFEGFSPEDVSQLLPLYAAGGSPPLASLYVVPASGGESVLLHRLEEPHGINTVHGEVEWSADGRYVFFATIRIAATGTLSQLWRVPAGGGQAERLDQLGGSSFAAFSMRMHPNGRELAFSAASSGGVELWVMENLFALTGQSADSP